MMVLAIAGMDSSGGAGIHADIKTCEYLASHCVAVVTAVTAQNNDEVSHIHHLPKESIEAQLTVISHSIQAMKIGMLGNELSINCIADFLKQNTKQVVLDPIMIASSGMNLFTNNIKDYLQSIKKLFPYVSVLTPNVFEAEKLTNQSITSPQAVKQAAQQILAMGVKSVVITGCQFAQSNLSQDYWSDGSQSFWLSAKRHPHKNVRGTGCTFSSAIAALLARGYDVKDALVVAKMYVTRGIRIAQAFSSMAALLHHGDWPDELIDLPYLSDNHFLQENESFASCETLGLYPVVDSSDWLAKLLPLGVKTIQLRLKNKSENNIIEEIRKSVALAKQYQAHLFVNDYWQYALQYDAYGVHLGQGDLNNADFNQLLKANIRLGISTHCYYEVARAHRYRPSYIAIGPVFATTSKEMPFAPQGLKQLNYWCRTLHAYPLVAIGGITLENLNAVLTAGVDGVAMISAITKATNPLATTQQFLEKIETNHVCSR